VEGGCSPIPWTFPIDIKGGIVSQQLHDIINLSNLHSKVEPLLHLSQEVKEQEEKVWWFNFLNFPFSFYFFLLFGRGKVLTAKMYGFVVYFRANRLQLLVDYALYVVAAILYAVCEFVLQPVTRVFNPNDPTLQYPFTEHETVPTWLLFVSALSSSVT